MIAFLSQPWPWYVGGLTFALIMILLAFTGKSFGISGTMRTICAIGGAGRYISFFNFEWKNEMWNIALAVGALIGGMIASTFLTNPEPLALAATTTADLAQMGISTDFQQLAPPEIFSWEGLLSLRGFLMVVMGGFLVGFGTRYAGGCTSGHAISGLSNLQLPSLIAVIGFFIGGLTATYLILPFILTL
jgi:uncharacterized protein